MEPVEQDSSPNIDLSAIIRTMQIITGALIAGVSFYAIFTLGPADGELEMMGMIALAFRGRHDHRAVHRSGIDRRSRDSCDGR